MSGMLNLGRWFAAPVAWLVAAPARAALDLNMPRGVTPFSREVYELHMLIFWICVAIGVVVFGAMIYSIIAHRKSRGVEPATFTHNTKVEVVWTTVPFIILFFMAIPATKTLIKMERTEGYDMTVKITGYQWKWQYEYIGEGVSFISSLDAASNRARRLDSGIDPASVENYLLDVDNPLVLPVDTKVRFLITAGDVIHSWWVPALGWKRDAIPGYINEAWTVITEPGTYRGQCAELCGKDHGFMPVVVEAVSQADYANWLAQQQAAAADEPSSTAQDGVAALAAGPGGDSVAGAAQVIEPAAGTPDAQREWSLDELMQRGEQVYMTNCVACHQPNGQGMPPAFPSLVDSEIVTGPIDAHLDNVINGVPGTAMQAFGQLISPADIAAVVTYERNAWGLNSGDVVQPADVKAGMNR